MSAQTTNGTHHAMSGEESEDEARRRREQLNRRPSYRMILKDLETADKAMKKEPDETPPSSVDASPLQRIAMYEYGVCDYGERFAVPHRTAGEEDQGRRLQVHIPMAPPPSGVAARVSSATSGAPSPYGSPLGTSLLPPSALSAHPLHHLNGELSQLQPGLAAAIAAAASNSGNHQNSSGNIAAAAGPFVSGPGAGPSNVQGLQMNDSSATAHVLKPLMDSSFAGEPQNWHSPLLSGYSSSPSPTSVGRMGGQMHCEDESNRKRQVRLLKNREAAKECRRKKKEYVKCLENRVAVLENQNKALIEELKTLKELYCRKEKNEM